MTDFRHLFLRRLYSLQPFSLVGDARFPQQSSLIFSCIIPTYDRWKELDTILYCLSVQEFQKSHFEVIVVEDGSTAEGRACLEKYRSLLQIKLIQTGSDRHCVGALRNKALECSQGEYLLFLDDDTQIYQADFLQNLHDIFSTKKDIDCIQISGKPDRCFIKGQYDFLDEFSFATRCVAYRRSRLILIGGFINSLRSYEDIELSIRFILSGGKFVQEDKLNYYHPPLYFNSYDKVITNGLSFFALISRYSFLLWLVCYLNAIRFLPFLLSPSMKQRQWGKISAGFVIALFNRFFSRKDVFYR